jgi:hypothetical protein
MATHPPPDAHGIAFSDNSPMGLQCPQAKHKPVPLAPSPPQECEICGRRRCTSESRQQTKAAGRPIRCGQFPPKNGKTCRYHGTGKGSSAAAAAEERTRQQEAEAALSRLLVAPGAELRPVTDPVASLQRLSGVLEAATARVGGEVTLDELDGPKARFLTVLVRELRQALADMARLGIEERMARLAEQEADLLEGGLRWWLAAMGMADDPRGGLLLGVMVGALGEGRVPTEQEALAALEPGRGAA